MGWAIVLIIMRRAQGILFTIATFFLSKLKQNSLTTHCLL